MFGTINSTKSFCKILSLFRDNDCHHIDKLSLKGTDLMTDLWGTYPFGKVNLLAFFKENHRTARTIICFWWGGRKWDPIKREKFFLKPRLKNKQRL